MKKLIHVHLCALLAGVAGAMPIPVGTVSENRTFAVRSGSIFNNGAINDYDGKILVLMMMTPWCSICQTNSRSVGTELLVHYNSASRNSLRGKNNRGIEIASLLLSTEEVAGFDSQNASFSTTNNYQQWGIDAKPNRTDPRKALGYYRDGISATSAPIPVGDDRRRLVVINLSRNSTTHAFGQIIINQNFFTSTDGPAARALIDGIQGPPPTVSFTQWRSNFTFSPGTDAPLDDADRDGVANLLEFYKGSHPTQGGSRPQAMSVDRSGSQPKLIYHRAKNLSGLTILHQYSSNLNRWFNYLDSELSFNVTRDLGTTEEVTVTLPATTDPLRLHRLSVTPN